MTDHFGGIGGVGGSGGLSEDQVNALIQGASVNNLTNPFSSEFENTYSMVTFADAGGRGVKRARVSQDDLVENGRVIINSNTAQSIQFPETRGASGYALTMHRDPVLAALGRTEWYSEAVVVPDVLQVSSLSSLNPGVTPLEIKTAVNFTGGQVVDYANSTCSNITTLDAVELKATTSLETPLVKNDTGTLSVTSSTGLNLTSSTGPVNLSTDALGQDVTVSAGGKIKLIATATECKGTLQAFGSVGVKASGAGLGTSLTFTDNFNFARGNLRTSDTDLVLESNDSRRLSLIGAGVEYMKIDPNNITTPFDVTVGNVGTGPVLVVGSTIELQAPTQFNVTSPLTQLSGNLVCDNIVCNNINQIRPTGGVYTESTDYTYESPGLSVDLLETGQSYGSLSVPANTYQAGDSYRLKAAGRLTCLNQDQFSLRIGTSGDLGDVNLSGFINVIVAGAQVGGWWDLEADYIIRSIGGPGTAALSINGSFSYTNTSAQVKKYGFDNTEGTNFRTDQANHIFFDIGSAEIANTFFFTITQANLTKTF